jgi:hypothetical protein
MLGRKETNTAALSLSTWMSRYLAEWQLESGTVSGGWRLTLLPSSMVMSTYSGKLMEYTGPSHTASVIIL